MAKKDLFDIYDDDDTPKNAKSPTFDAMLKYQKHHLELLKTYSKEISYFDDLLRSCREERKKFLDEDILAIRKKLTENHIDEAVQNEWLNRLMDAMMHNFDETDRLISAFAVQRADEFNEALKEKLQGL